MFKSRRSSNPLADVDQKHRKPHQNHIGWSTINNRATQKPLLLLVLFLVILYIGLDAFLPQQSPCGPLEIRTSHDELSTTSQRTASIGKVTMSYGDKIPPIYTEVLAGHQEHADMHNHEMFVLRERLLHRLWSKSAYMLSVLLQEGAKPKNERLKWLYWFDADVILMNHQIPLDIFLPPEPDFRHIHLVVANDHNGLNSGGFFIRVNEWAIQFFADAVAMTTYRPDLKLKYSEQSAMEILAKDDMYKNNTVVVPQRWFNAYRGPRGDDEEILPNARVPPNTVMPGDIHLHFAGKPELKNKMEHWMRLAQSRSPIWEVPLNQTSYPKEIEAFWTDQRKELAKRRKEEKELRERLEKAGKDKEGFV